MKIETKLLSITAGSQYRLIKEIWNQSASPRSVDLNRGLVINVSTSLRKQIFKAITSADMLSADPICREIAEDDVIPLIRKNICILAIYGIDAGCIADLNCVNIGYVRMCIRSLKEEYPELFR